MTNEKRLIDINYALKQLEIGELENGGSFSTDSSHIKDFLKVLPNVDAVEVVHGRWLPAYKVNWWMGTETIDGFTCNQCARYFKSKLRLNYCPNCGAKMDEEN